MLAQKIVDLLRQLLERGAGGAPTARTRGHAGHKRAQAQRLQNLGCDHHFLVARLTGRRRERDANRVANALLQQHRQRGARGHRALGAHAGLGQAQMQGIAGGAAQFAVHRNQVLDATDLAGNNDLAGLHAHGLRQFGRAHSRTDQRLVHHLLHTQRLSQLGVGVHQTGEQFLVQAAPVHADAHRFVPAQRGFDHLAKLAVFFVALAHVAGVNAVFGQGLRAVGKVGEQAVAVEMEIAHQRHRHAHAVQLLADIGYGLRRLGRVDRDTHHLRARERQFLHLDGCANGIDRVGVGHGLDAHRRAAANGDDVAAPGHPGLQTLARRAAVGVELCGVLHHCTLNLATLPVGEGSSTKG